MNQPLTVGLLCDGPINQYSCDMWYGFRDAALAEGVRLVYFAAGIPGWNLGFREQSNVIFERINAANLDGLVVWGAQLSHIQGPEAIKKLCQSFIPLPICSIGLEMDTTLNLVADNRQGIYDATEKVPLKKS